jgi:hypothetical protein
MLNPVAGTRTQTKQCVRTRSHPFLIVKRIFGFEKTRYRGLSVRLHAEVPLVALPRLMKMTIQYTNYEIRSQDAVGDLPASDLERTASSVGAQPAKPRARAKAAKE